MERDYLAENVAYLTKDLGKCNISQNLFQRFKELIMIGQLPSGYMLPNENIVSDMLGVGVARQATSCWPRASCTNAKE